MFKWGIRNRLMVSFLVLIVVTMLLLGSYILWYFYQHNLESLTANLLIDAQITEQLLHEQLRGPQERAGIDDKIKEISTATDLRITVIDPNGVVLADSWENPAIMEDHSQRPEVLAALSGNTGTVTRYSSTINQNMLYVSIPARLHGEILGVVRVASTLAHVESGFAKIRSTLLAALLLTSLLAIVLSIRLARRYTAPLEEITNIARQIADGHLDKRAHIHTGDELELLAHTLNNLTSSLEDKINEIIAETRKLELILQHMDNAVILLDRYGKVTTANKTANNIFGITPSMLGEHNIQVIGNSWLDRSAHQVIVKNESQTIDLKTNIQGAKRVFQVFLAPITINEKDTTGVLCVFHDITTLQEMQERQADFVANASHELATPLTAIKGFAETLLDGALLDGELSLKFVNIIHTEAERMHRMIKELLQLAKLNSQEYRQQIKLEPTPLEPLLRLVTQELATNADRKHITIVIEPDLESLQVMAHPDWLKQALVNLVDNSIKYTPDNGTIYLAYWQEGHEISIMVKDTGIGIPASDLPLIFDRFYRVDRARARNNAGGTGLGLAIVKFIVEMHGGKINVKSDIHTGTTFIFTLPQLANPH
jgi:two-component system phosphate regulon sensor histidine kinase PhoR